MSKQTIDVTALPVDTEVTLDYSDHDAPGKSGTVARVIDEEGETFYYVRIAQEVFVGSDQIRSVKDRSGTWQYVAGGR